MQLLDVPLRIALQLIPTPMFTYNLPIKDHQSFKARYILR